MGRMSQKSPSSGSPGEPGTFLLPTLGQETEGEVVSTAADIQDSCGGIITFVCFEFAPEIEVSGGNGQSDGLPVYQPVTTHSFISRGKHWPVRCVSVSNRCPWHLRPQRSRFLAQRCYLYVNRKDLLANCHISNNQWITVDLSPT